MTYLITFGAVIAGAAFAAYAGNRGLLRLLGANAAVTAVPWWEEACKMAAVLVLPGLPILPVHVLFGAVELGYDLSRSRSDGFFLGMLSFSGHGLFGGLAALVAGRFEGLWWAYLIAGLAHTLYNLAIVAVVLPSLGARAYADSGER